MYASAAPPKFFVTLIGAGHVPFRLGVNPPLPVPASETVSINTTIDFYDGLEARGFKFDNPNAVKSCGCGSSFQA